MDNHLKLKSNNEKIAEDITFGDFVLVKYSRLKSIKYYVGCVDNYDQNQ